MTEPTGHLYGNSTWNGRVTRGREAPTCAFRPGRGSVLDLGLPGLLDVSDHVRWHRHVVQLLGQFATVLVSPAEELECLGGGCLVSRLLVHQDPGRRRNRPRVVTRLV